MIKDLLTLNYWKTMLEIIVMILVMVIFVIGLLMGIATILVATDVITVTPPEPTVVIVSGECTIEVPEE